MEMVGFIVMSIVTVGVFTLPFFSGRRADPPREISADGSFEKKKEKVARKSDAYIQGYKDMLLYGMGYDTEFVYDYPEDMYSLHSPYYSVMRTVNSRPVTRVYFSGPDRTPHFAVSLLDSLARSIMDKVFTIDVDAGQCNRTYLGGTEQEFTDYYAGGMKFLEDLDLAKQMVIEKKIEEENRDRLIESRKKGLTENNRQIVMNMSVLDELRATTFKPWEEISERQSWDRQMNELEGK